MPVPDLLPIDPDTPAGGMAPLFMLDEEIIEPEQEESVLKEVASEFDPRHREDFVGLMYVGYLEEECTVAGHRFLLRTPSQVDKLEIGPMHKPYVNTTTGEQAWTALTVASYLRRIDNTDAPEPLTPNVSPVRTRYEWMRNSIYHDFVIVELFQNCLLLDAKVRAQIEELNRLGESLTPPVS